MWEYSDGLVNEEFEGWKLDHWWKCGMRLCGFLDRVGERDEGRRKRDEGRGERGERNVGQENEGRERGLKKRRRDEQTRKREFTHYI